MDLGRDNYTPRWESFTSQWCHNDHDGVSNHQPHGCLLNRLFRCRSKKTSKLRVTGLCAGNSPGPVNSPQKVPIMRKMFPFDDVIMHVWELVRLILEIPWWSTLWSQFNSFQLDTFSHKQNTLHFADSERVFSNTFLRMKMTNFNKVLLKYVLLTINQYWFQ